MVAVVEVIVGAVVVDEAESTSNCQELEAPPPGAEFCTVMVVVPAVAISAAVTDAVNWFAFTYAVARAVEPQ